MKRGGAWWLAAVAAVMLVVTGACGGGDSDSDRPSADVEAEVPEDAPADDEDQGDAVAADDEEAEADFSCPVTLADVEEAYAPLQFEDAEIGVQDCTFLTEDGVGSVVVTVERDAGETGYDAILASTGGGQAIAGTGDEAAYAAGRPTFVARVGKTIVTVSAVSTLGVGGAEVANSPELLENIEKATIAVGKKAVAGL